MLRLYQGQDDCFATAVACVLEVPVSTLPHRGPTMIPDDVLDVWYPWAESLGYSLSLESIDPGGLCIANIRVEGAFADEKRLELGVPTILHAVVWDDGIVWNPEIFSRDENMKEVHSYVKIERM